MNQIISQHGWALDCSVWDKLKENFIKDSWLWQDNDRGYYSSQSIVSNWIENNSSKNIKLLICHSLGTQLIEPKVISKASHIVFINSFYKFIPEDRERNLTIRTLQRMGRKFNSKQIKLMLNDFFRRSFLPNTIETNFQNSFQSKLKNINISILENDFRKLYLETESPKLISNKCNVLIIKSNKDLILRENSSNQFIKKLNKSQNNKPQVINIENAGHIINNFDVFEIIKKWLI